MTDKVLVIISSGMEGKEKAISGMNFAANTKKGGLFSDVKVIFFGPSEKAIASGDKEFEAGVKNLRDAGINVLACSRVAENNGIKDLLLQKSIPMEPVGPVIANYIKQGYAVMTF
ncbi:hypothetical protein GCM10007108_15600 [Thermogymnomonas acidicola]|uniref:Uncharacterized protein n=1 Tax=Thermogymnomonas acidicola TaxID=399579 RepID=A0AA37F9Z0_9ARCH|nr:DsrE family protein [Thermogymnomonas acidicola]GGM78328.1 hypothetical protein GCM10007108_15600 [Thermogymnomonas acidicola]